MLLRPALPPPNSSTVPYTTYKQVAQLRLGLPMAAGSSSSSPLAGNPSPHLAVNHVYHIRRRQGGPGRQSTAGPRPPPPRSYPLPGMDASDLNSAGILEQSMGA